MPSLPPPITSRTNARVKALRASLSGEARKPGDLLGLEGEHLVGEAVHAGLSLETLFVREGSDAILRRDDWPARLGSTDVVVLSRDVFESAVSTASPQGIAATWRIADLAQPPARNPAALVLENLQDPGNLGTLIRSAVAFGVSDILVTPETVNQWNPKVVRSAAGAIFRQKITRLPLGDIVDRLRSEGLRLFAAVSEFMMDGPPSSIASEADFAQPCAILVGNEGAGLSREARTLADEQVRIPCGVESLNAAVAGSVLLYEMMRQRTLQPTAYRQTVRP